MQKKAENRTYTTWATSIDVPKTRVNVKPQIVSYKIIYIKLNNPKPWLRRPRSFPPVAPEPSCAHRARQRPTNFKKTLNIFNAYIYVTSLSAVQASHLNLIAMN